MRKKFLEASFCCFGFFLEVDILIIILTVLSALLPEEHIPVPVLATEGCYHISAYLGICREGEALVRNKYPSSFPFSKIYTCPKEKG